MSSDSEAERAFNAAPGLPVVRLGNDTSVMPYDPTTGLVTVYNHADEKTIDRDLKKLDLRLFLVAERAFTGEPYYEVRFWNGSEQEATLVVDWREPTGFPKPLSTGIVYEVQRMMAKGPLDIASITKRNEELKRAREQEAEDWYREMAVDFGRVHKLGTRTLMPRSGNVAANARRQRLRDAERRMGMR